MIDTALKALKPKNVSHIVSDDGGFYVKVLPSDPLIKSSGKRALWNRAICFVANARDSYG